MGAIEKLNHSVADSFVGRYFRLEGSGARRERAGSKFTTEVRAGITTFVTMVRDLSQPARSRVLIESLVSQRANLLPCQFRLLLSFSGDALSIPLQSLSPLCPLSSPPILLLPLSTLVL